MDSATVLIDRARQFLEDNLEAKIGEDPDWRCAVFSRATADRDFDTNIRCETTVMPFVKVSLHPAQYERLLGILAYIVDPELRDSLSYRTPQEMQAYDILCERARERQLRTSHPTVKEAYEQYMTAIRLCT